MHESIVFCSTCTMSSYRKFTFAISSPDEFLVVYGICSAADGFTSAARVLHCIDNVDALMVGCLRTVLK